MTTLEATIPFAGFYESIHSSQIDYAIEEMFYRYGDGTYNTGLKAIVNDTCDFRMVYVNYVIEYTRAFSEKFEISTLKFDEMTSPREYNFTTDRIFVKIDLSEVNRILTVIEMDVFVKMAKSMFTSRSGFASFYDPDITTWGDVGDWDCNQVGCLLAAYAEDITGDFRNLEEFYLMEDAFGNGHLDRWIGEATPNISRLYKIYEYLERRESR